MPVADDSWKTEEMKRVAYFGAALPPQLPGQPKPTNETLTGWHLRVTQFPPNEVELLLKFPNLEQLTIPALGYTDASMDVIAQLKKLKSLDVGGNPITDTGVAQLQRERYSNTSDPIVPSAQKATALPQKVSIICGVLLRARHVALYAKNDQNYRFAPTSAGTLSRDTRSLFGLGRNELELIVSPNLAYFDPGPGSLLLQVVLGGLAGLAVLARCFWNGFVERRRHGAPGTINPDATLDSAAVAEMPGKRKRLSRIFRSFGGRIRL